MERVSGVDAEVAAEATQEREEDLTYRDYFRRINEKLDAMKMSIFAYEELEWRPSAQREYWTLAINHERMLYLAEKATDTIAAITSLLESMGIDEKMMQEAQQRLNERERGRIE